MISDVGKALLTVLRTLPQRVLIKWESEDLIELPPNVMTYKWIPQQDVLAHKNCILFLTHGGLLSLTEAVFHGVPVIGLPTFADQPKNILHAVRYGYGLHLALENITQSSVSWAIHEVLSNPRYKEEISRRSKMLRDKRQNSLEEAIYWVEHAMKYPNALTPKAAELNFFQLHLIDIKLFILILLFIAYILLCRVIKLSKKYCYKFVKEKRH